MPEGRVEILLVEDSPADLELSLHALRKNNISNKIEVVRDGEQALDFVFCRGAYVGRRIEDHPKLILLDLKLPKVHGIDVLRAIRGDPRTAAIPVVALTSSAEDRDVVDTYGLHVNSYIVKPVEFDDFAEVVRQLGLYWVLLNRPLRFDT